MAGKKKFAQRIADKLLADAIKFTDNGTWFFFYDEFENEREIRLEAIPIVIMLSRNPAVAEARADDDGIEVVLYDDYWEG